MKVFVSKDGQQYGPYTSDQLRKYVQQGNFATNDLACHDGQNWVTIREVPGFAEGRDSLTTPHRKQIVQKQKVEQQSVPAKTSDGPSMKKKPGTLWAIIGGGVTLVAAGLLIWFPREEDQREPGQDIFIPDYPAFHQEPITIPCFGCEKPVRLNSEKCTQCWYPTKLSVAALMKKQERERQEKLARIRDEKERQRLDVEAAEKIVKDERQAIYKAAIKKFGEEPFSVPVLSMEMLWCKPGTFTMGSSPSEEGREEHERQHTVTLTQGFWLGKHEVTQNQWELVMNTNPSRFKGTNLPVEKVSWDDARSFCSKLNELERSAGRLPVGMAYQLPTESEWEYACRSGSTEAYSFGAIITEKQANFDFNLRKTMAVGSYPANQWGFFDMHGNVREWCEDWYSPYPKATAVDPIRSERSADSHQLARWVVQGQDLRILRGGGWESRKKQLRSANRGSAQQNYRYDAQGFRVAFKVAE